MRRALGVGAAVIVVVLLAWWLRRGNRATPATTARPARAAPPDPIRSVRSPDAPATASPGSAGARGTASAVRSSIDAGSKEADPPPPAIRPLAEVAAEAGPRLRAAAAPCVDDDVASGAAFTFRYTLVIAAGVARIDDVAVVSSGQSDPDVEDCVVSALDGVTWESPGAAEARLGVQDVIVLSDLLPP